VGIKGWEAKRKGLPNFVGKRQHQNTPEAGPPRSLASMVVGGGKETDDRSKVKKREIAVSLKLK